MDFLLVREPRLWNSFPMVSFFNTNKLFEVHFFIELIRIQALSLGVVNKILLLAHFIGHSFITFNPTPQMINVEAAQLSNQTGRADTGTT